MMDRGSSEGGDEDLAYAYRRIIGRRIRELRIDSGLTQRELGQAVEVGDTAISALELGRSSVSPERYAHFADVFGIEKSEWGKWLLRYTDPFLYALIYNDEKGYNLEHDIKLLTDASRLNRKRGTRQ